MVPISTTTSFTTVLSPFLNAPVVLILKLLSLTSPSPVLLAQSSTTSFSLPLPKIPSKLSVLKPPPPLLQLLVHSVLITVLFLLKPSNLSTLVLLVDLPRKIPLPRNKFFLFLSYYFFFFFLY